MCQSEQCRRRGGRSNLSIEFAREVAARKGGECLSETYSNNHTPLLWRCSEGHEWKASLKSVSVGNSWCPTCAGKAPLSIEFAREVAARKGGKCLSETYSNNKTPLLWRCSNGHEWTASLKSVSGTRDTWCASCAGKTPHSIELAHEVAAKKGGECLSETYSNNKAPLLWRCSKGHEWKASLKSVCGPDDTWCRVCAKAAYVSEGIVRAHFEAIFGRKFPNTRPKFLGKLELDGYCRELKLAFEHQGRQHYGPVDCFGGDAGFKNIRARDRRKAEICKQHGVKLIAVPELGRMTKREELREFILSELDRTGVAIPAGRRDAEADLGAVYGISQEQVA